MKLSTTLVLATSALAIAGIAKVSIAKPMAGGESQKPTIILVHGAFADASGWGRVITLLEKDGYRVKAVQNPLTGIAEDVATTKRMIEGCDGPVVVVGHSYGGAVITGAAAGEANVKSLVYIAAYGPEEKEILGALNGKFGDSALATAVVPDKAGYLTIDPTKFHSVFCADVAAPEARIMALTQKPCNSVVFGSALDVAAWKTIPSWYMVATEDKTIKPELQRFMAKRMNATVKEVKSSHVAFISHPSTVVKLIEDAAR